MTTTFEQWELFLTKLMPSDVEDLTGAYISWGARFRTARETAREVESDHKIYLARKAANFFDGLYLQTQALDALQSRVLIQEIVNFVQHGPYEPPPEPGALPTGQAVKMEIFTSRVRETYNVVVESFWRPLSDAEHSYSILRGERLRKARMSSLDIIGELHDRFKKDFPKVKVYFDAMQADLASQLPGRFRPVLRKTVELFVYEPYRLGIEYIERNLPSATGAFYGLEEE